MHNSNPVKLIDPDGRSTWVDGRGDVKNVVNDQDLGVYRPVPPGFAGPPEKLGETWFWDSFMDSSGRPAGHINVGVDITKDFTRFVNESREKGLMEIVLASRDKRELDLKHSWPGVPVTKGKATQGFPPPPWHPRMP